jgi:hypothetical protein
MPKSPLIFLMGVLISSPLLGQQPRPLPTKLVQARGCLHQSGSRHVHFPLVADQLRLRRLKAGFFSCFMPV